MAGLRIETDIDQLQIESREVFLRGLAEMQSDAGGSTAQFESCPGIDAILSVLRDLTQQGWTFHVEGNQVIGARPDKATDPTEEKTRLRRNLQINRSRSIRRSSVQSFVRKMESAGFKGPKSIFRLMADGTELLARLDQSGVHGITPYLQMVTNDRCLHTGLRLRDIYRYFRLTWENEARSVPGRTTSFLVRDGRGPYHPVIGLLSFSSSVPALRPRDLWIGWDVDSAYERLSRLGDEAKFEWVTACLQRSLDGLEIGDFVAEGMVSANPFHSGPESIQALREEADRCREAHRLYPEKEILSKLDKGLNCDWQAVSKTTLYRYKRASSLATLLETHARLLVEGELVWPRRAKGSGGGLARLIREVQSRGVAYRMMDISVCGAIAPYNHLLGGKLVTMLAASDYVRKTMEAHYSARVSAIASGKAGKPISNRTQLAILCTTSLYAVAASQYNRVSLPLARLGIGDDDLKLLQLGFTKGFGTFHFSDSTIDKISRVISHSKYGRRVNSIFGEGVSPRLRKIRNGLKILGLSEDFLKHGDRRRVYGYSLLENAQDFLLEIDADPKSSVRGDPSQFASEIVGYWKDRWLDRRRHRDETRLRVLSETLALPLRHRARVPAASEELNLFS